MTFVVPNPDRVWGIDISGRWDGNVDFTATKRAGATFAIIKCIDGTVPTRLWKENRIRAFMAGLLVGEYAWLYRDANVPCKDQARATWELIKNEPKQIPVAIDFEWTRYMGTAANPDYSDLDKWVTEFTRLSGYKPGFYSAAGYMNDYGAMPLNLRSKFAYFWVANYGVIKPTLPIGFTEWDFWQFAATGDASVVAPNDTGKLETDLNYWNGSLQTLKDLAGYSEPPTQPPTEGVIMSRYEAVSVYPMSLRPDHTTANSPLGSAPAQSRMQGDELWTSGTLEKWLKVTSINGQPIRNAAGQVVASAWVAIVAAGRIYCSLNEITPPPEPEPIAIPEYLIAHFADGTERRYLPE